MLNNEKGFTLIELIIVIVILGILAVVAVPRYQNLRTEAAVAAADGVYGAAEGACAINFAARLVSPTMANAIDDVTELVAAMGGTPEGWTAADPTLTGPDGHVITLTDVTPANDASVPTTRASVAKGW